jgi:hypothetical protein
MAYDPEAVRTAGKTSRDAWIAALRDLLATRSLGTAGRSHTPGVSAAVDSRRCPVFGHARKRPSDDRDALIAEARNMLNALKLNCDTTTYVTFASKFANLWREFELAHGSRARFSELPGNVKHRYVDGLVQRSAQLRWELRKLDAQRAAKSTRTDALCSWAAARLLSFYLLAVMAGDKEWEAELAPFLEKCIVKGYESPWDLFPPAVGDTSGRSDPSCV